MNLKKFEKWYNEDSVKGTIYCVTKMVSKRTVDLHIKKLIFFVPSFINKKQTAIINQ